ncbi:hypothetical protein C0989_005288 [Termitomyces sp. Mn162]|nr:hypothetical protein C0989_005288 [Termitomyces sp. Mn162]
MAPQTPWNASGNTNWQAGATNSIQSSIPTNSANPLNAANLHETPKLLDTNPNNHDGIPDPTNDQEALCVNRIWDSPWIDMLEETQEKQQKEGITPPSHSSTNLLLCTTLPFTDNPVPTLVDSSATDNFINESLVALAPHLLRRLPTPIPLKLFDRDPTPAGDITHCLETTMTFANRQQQELQLLITKLHSSTPIILGFSWLCSTNPHVNWPSLTLHLDWDNPTNSELFQAQLLITQLPLLTPIVLRLPWLQDVNPDIDWKNLTMQFPSPEASLAATIPLHLQSISDSDVSHPSASTSGVTQSPSTSNDNSNKEGDATMPRSPSITLRQLPLNIPRNQYKGPWYPNQQHSKSPTNSTTTLDSSTTTLMSNFINSGNLNIKIIGTVLFARLLQDSTPTFQLQIMPALPEEHLRTGTTMLESKMEEQILSEVVPPEYYEFADVFSEESAKELPLHCSYNHKIDLKEGTSPLFGKIYNMSEIEL